MGKFAYTALFVACMVVNLGHITIQTYARNAMMPFPFASHANQQLPAKTVCWGISNQDRHALLAIPHLTTVFHARTILNVLSVLTGIISIQAQKNA